MYFVVQGQVIMLIALSRASGRVVLLLFFCWDSLAFRSNDDSLFLLLFK